MYVPLKVTTDYSLLKSTIKIDNLISFLKENNIPACAICDDHLYGVMEFYDKCKKNDIKPIIGLDIKYNDKHLYLYAKNFNGYQNLLKINTIISDTEISLKDLEIYAKDILMIIPYLSISLYNEINNIFNDVYLGYQNENEKEKALTLSKNIVYVNNIKSLTKEDAIFLNYLDMIRLDEKNRNYKFKSYEDNYYKEVDDETSFNVSLLLNVEISMNNNFIPKYKKTKEESLEYLENLSKKGLNKRLMGNTPDTYLNRLNYELDVIKKMGFADYILIVYDYVLYAKKNNILVGPGRGSAAGSLVCYALGITDIDPIKYNLLFERFLNPERVSMPDIDIDFENTKRYQVIDYLKEKYGYSKVASIVTFSSLKSKLVLKEVAKIMDYEKDIDFLLKKISPNETLKEVLANKEINGLINNDETIKQIFKVALKIEGIKKNISTHAAGIVLSSIELDEIIPVIRNKDLQMTGITMEYLESLGLLKMDLLALKNLTIIANVLDLIKKDTSHNINLSQIPLNDEKVLNLFKQGDTAGIFQFESRGIRNFLIKLKPTSFEDLVACIALYRPGPMDNINLFIKRKENKEKIDYIIPDLKPILEETYGIIVYQEQVMQILVKIGSYTFAEADLIRRAMSKKKRSIIESEEQNFIKRAVKNGYKEESAREIYNMILKFANYGFNKSHSVSYALIGYQMAYLKVKFGNYFLINLLNMSIGSEIKTYDYILEAKNKNLLITKPEINQSDLYYKINNNEIILPLSSIKGLGSITIDSILNERNENGDYKDFIDFVVRNYKKNMNENILTILIEAEVFRNFGSIKTLKENLNIVLNYAEVADFATLSLIPRPVLKIYDDENVDEYANELKYYGFYISNHPASKYNSDRQVKLINAPKYFDKRISCVVMIESITRIKTKQNEDMAFIDASDETGKMNFVVFAKQMSLLTDLKIKDIVEMQGRVTKRVAKYQINVNNLIKM